MAQGNILFGRSFQDRPRQLRRQAPDRRRPPRPCLAPARHPHSNCTGWPRLSDRSHRRGAGRLPVARRAFLGYYPLHRHLMPFLNSLPGSSRPASRGGPSPLLGSILGQLDVRAHCRRAALCVAALFTLPRGSLLTRHSIELLHRLAGRLVRPLSLQIACLLCGISVIASRSANDRPLFRALEQAVRHTALGHDGHTKALRWRHWFQASSIVHRGQIDSPSNIEGGDQSHSSSTPGIHEGPKALPRQMTVRDQSM